LEIATNVKSFHFILSVNKYKKSKTILIQ